MCFSAACNNSAVQRRVHTSDANASVDADARTFIIRKGFPLREYMCSAGANYLKTNNLKGAVTSASVKQTNKSEKKKKEWSVVEVVSQG